MDRRRASGRLVARPTASSPPVHPAQQRSRAVRVGQVRLPPGCACAPDAGRWRQPSGIGRAMLAGLAIQAAIAPGPRAPACTPAARRHHAHQGGAGVNSSGSRTLCRAPGGSRACTRTIQRPGGHGEDGGPEPGRAGTPPARTTQAAGRHSEQNPRDPLRAGRGAGQAEHVGQHGGFSTGAQHGLTCGLAREWQRGRRGRATPCTWWRGGRWRAWPPLACRSRASPRLAHGRSEGDPGGSLEPNTAQTPGHGTGGRDQLRPRGAQKLWAGTVNIHPNAKTGAHHHGALESVIYVVTRPCADALGRASGICGGGRARRLHLRPALCAAPGDQCHSDRDAGMRAGPQRQRGGCGQSGYRAGGDGPKGWPGWTRSTGPAHAAPSLPGPGRQGSDGGQAGG